MTIVVNQFSNKKENDQLRIICFLALISIIISLLVNDHTLQL